MADSTIPVSWPVDCIISTEEHYVLGSYKYDCERSGMLHYLSKSRKEIVCEVETSGTLCLSNMGGLIYAANSQGISVYSLNKQVKGIQTNHINTYIDCNHSIAVSDTGGYVSIYNYNLECLKRLKISEDSVWVSKHINDCLYIGSEEGLAYEYDYEKESLIQIGERRLGILDFIEINGLLHISSYDDTVKAFDKRTGRFSREFKETGSLWKMVCQGQTVHAASMYDGYRVFDSNFNLLDKTNTNSICYGLCVTEEEVLWSSFYDNSIFWRKNKYS